MKTKQYFREARSWKALNEWDFFEGDFVIFRPMGGEILHFESFLSYFLSKLQLGSIIKVVFTFGEIT